MSSAAISASSPSRPTSRRPERAAARQYLAGRSPSSSGSWARIIASSRRSSGPGSSPSSSTSSRRPSRIVSSASAWRPARYRASISCPRRRSRSGFSDTSARSSPTRSIGRRGPARRQPLLDRLGVQLLEPGDLALREFVEAVVGQGRAAPQRERLGQLLSRSAGARGFQQRLEAAAVDRVALDLQRVAGGAPAHRAAARPRARAGVTPASAGPDRGRQAAGRPRPPRRADRPSPPPAPAVRARRRAGAAWRLRTPPSRRGPPPPGDPAT